MNTINVAILGLGTVGAGTLDLLQKNAEEITRRTGQNIRVTHAGSRRPRPDLNLDGVEVSSDLQAIASHPGVDVVIELMGGTTDARTAIETAIQHGKHVVTANKALLARYGNELFELAGRHGAKILFEAAVAGGIPIIKVLREGLAANRIEWLAGIINGTGNFILTEMRDKGTPFEEVLKEAQRLGYAEADPTFDVEGIDAAHKLTILASLAFGIPLQFDRVFTEGITRLTAQDVEYAEELGYRIKHLGIARRTPEGIELRVHPTLIPKQRLIANANGVKNAVLVQSNAVGPTLYYGAGAGAGPTASAVVADLVDLARALKTGSTDSLVAPLAFQPDQLDTTPILPADQMTTAYYLRIQAANHPGVIAEISGILSKAGINIDALMQKPQRGEAVPVVIMTQPVKEVLMNQAIAEIEAHADVSAPITKIRVESLEG